MSQFLDRRLLYDLPFNLRDLTDHELDRGRLIENLEEQSVLGMKIITMIDYGKTLADSKFALKIVHQMIGGNHTIRMI